MLFVICWSGTVAVFSYEIDRLLNPSLKANSPTNETPWQAIYQKVSSHYPSYQINEINSPLKPGYAAEVIASDKDERVQRIYVDPLTIKITGETTYFNVQRFFRSFHMALFQPDFIHIMGVPIGYFVVGIFGLVLLAAVITGFIFYRNWRSGFFLLRINRGIRLFWSDFHKLVGLWSLWFGLLISLTGTWYLIEWWLPEPSYSNTAMLADVDKSNILPINQLLQSAQLNYPELKIAAVKLYNYPKGHIRFEGLDGTLLVRQRAAYIELNGTDGSVLEINRPANLSILKRWMEAVDFLHFGNFGGLIIKWLYFIFGLALSALCLTGAYLQSKRQQLKLGIKQYRNSILVAYLLTSALLAMACFAGFQEIKAYGAIDKWPTVPLSVILFISAWILSTFLALGIWVKFVK